MKYSRLSAALFSVLFFSSMGIGINDSAEKDFPRLTGKYFGQKEPPEISNIYWISNRVIEEIRKKKEQKQ